MNILGFQGAHPILYSAFVLAPAIVALGPWLLWRGRARLSARAFCLFGVGYALFLLYILVGVRLGLLEGMYRFMFLSGSMAVLAALDGVAALALWRATRPAHHAAAHAASRRRFLAAGVVAAAGSLAALPGFGAATGKTQDGVLCRTVRIPRHPAAQPGRPLRLSLVTDLHAGFFLPEAVVAGALAHVRAFRPDVVLFGGDLVEYDLEPMEQVRPFFTALTDIAPLYAVLGNHDCYLDKDAICGFFRSLGAVALRDERVELRGEWGDFGLCGAPDFWECQGLECLTGADPANAILLAHNPQTAMRLPAGSAPWLTLSGHTHGGQIRLPLMGPVVNQADRRIVAGLNEVDGRRIVVSAGLGFAGLPVRLSCPPDVTNVVIV